MWYGYLADAIAVVHFAYAAFVGAGLIVIIMGAIRGWRWVRNFWFRLAHLIAIVVVGAEAAWGWDCPLTSWENDLRQLAGRPVSDASFIGRLFHEMLFVDVPLSVLNAIHIGVALLVLATFVLVPPRRPWRRSFVGAPRPTDIRL
jgi:hypothetical protein